MRFVRSIGQGALVVDLALYLKALGWSGFAIGSVLGGAGLMAGFLSLAVGVISDRWRRRPFLLLSALVTLSGAVLALLTANPWILVPAILMAGFGRGMNGAASFFSPAEQAWLARVVRRVNRGRVYSINTAVGSTGMAVGAALAALPSVLAPLLGPTLSYRPLFLIPLLGALVNLVLLIKLRELPRPVVAQPVPAKLQKRTTRPKSRQDENRLLTRLAGLNILNGFAIGLISPLLSYWFAVRFGVGPADLSPFMALTFLTTGAGALVAAQLTEKIGVVPTVVSLRSFGVLILALLPIAPLYALAAGMYAFRSALNRSSVGARQALAVSLVGDERRGFVSSLNASSMQISQAAGPVVAGALLDMGQLMLPFFLAAALQALYVLGYWKSFRKHDPTRDEPSLTGEAE